MLLPFTMLFPYVAIATVCNTICRDRVGVKGEGMRPACMPGCLGAWMLLVSVPAAPQRNKGLPHNTHSVQEREKILYFILNQSEI
jgi:hypothetical protein